MFTTYMFTMYSGFFSMFTIYFFIIVNILGH